MKGVFLCSKYAVPPLKKSKRGVITNIGSNWGIVAEPNASVYCASKAGVILLTKAMAMDVAADDSSRYTLSSFGSSRADNCDNIGDG